MAYSPILAILTAIFEILAVVWALIGPGRRPIIYTSAALLFILASYQIFEVIICTVPKPIPFLPHLAFIIITWLPPTGLLLISKLKSSKNRVTNLSVWLMYALAIIIVLWISLDQHFVTETICTIVFARYSNPIPQFVLYCVFYWLGLLGMVILSAFGVLFEPDSHCRLLLKQVLIGTLVFVIPSLFTLQFIPVKEGAAPSILCHYALLFAVFLVRLIYLERRFSSSEEKT